jgi:hypothetical protein
MVINKKFILGVLMVSGFTVISSAVTELMQPLSEKGSAVQEKVASLDYVAAQGESYKVYPTDVGLAQHSPLTSSDLEVKGRPGGMNADQLYATLKARGTSVYAAPL